ncbi:alpha/beta hydrolase [Brevibacillus migulae]|uniref:alpha/beta hydrolase n=1 Tax=Brevibacillus migulae TaxID=1644114 RepID=UPI00106DD37A|nr:alpha/beta hydrolase family protein [Brevibacillus migulae]
MGDYESLVDIHTELGRLAGILHLPPPAMRPCPIVIYCPGKNGERYEVHRLAVKFARKLAKTGIAFLRFDYYGMGLSDGFYHEMTNSKKVANVLAAYQFIESHPDIIGTQTAFLGFSDGARIALMAANRTHVERLLLWSPLFYEWGGNFPNKKHPRFSRHPKHPDTLVMPWAGLWVGMDFYRDLQAIDIVGEMSAYRASSLLIYGDDDPLIAEEMEQLKTDLFSVYAGNETNSVKVVQGAGHLFTSRVFEEQLMDASAAWLISRFTRAKGGL